MLDPDRRHLIAYLAAAAVLVVIAVRFIGHQGADASVPSISMAAPASPSAGRRRARPREAPASSIWVDVAGAVRRPGLYSLPIGSRAAAALERAGGARSRANTTAVNLAAKLVDGQQIVVPIRGRGGYGVAAPATPVSPAGDGSAAAGPGAKISLSTASQAQLEELDGIGPGLAGRIIEYRQAHGGFRSIDQLQEVSGIGQKRFAALRGKIAP
ncbi:MAG: helix-hairpin-helix domain-containing protein [Thermoleophilaceae bacterium]